MLGKPLEEAGVTDTDPDTDNSPARLAAVPALVLLLPGTAMFNEWMDD
jgi:hypothetical protein